MSHPDSREPGSAAVTDSSLDAFRAEVRDWIAANKPEHPGFKLPQSFLEVESDRQYEYLLAWQRKVYDAGYLGYDTPEEYGGRGVDRERAAIVAQELSRGRAPFFVNFIGLNWALPTILHYGSDEQKRRLLGPLLRGDEIWCQGFSEPEYGSDLAGLQARATRFDGGYRITGHKVWTTLAHVSKWMILLARTDFEVNKYQGISYFLFPMDSEGVEVQPLVKMTGEGGFNQVLFDDAFVDEKWRLGSEGQGWEIAMTTLLFERGAGEGKGVERAGAFTGQIARLARLAGETRVGGQRLADDPVVRDQIARLWTEAQSLGLGALRGSVKELAQERPLALRLMTKLVGTELNQRVNALACDILGPDAVYWLGDEHAPAASEWQRGYLSSFGMTIGGGTSEIQRNILGERVLGLPKSK